MASKNDELENELKAAAEWSARLERNVRRYWRSQGTKPRTAERGSSSGRVGSPEWHGSSEVGSPAHKKRK